MSSGSCPEGYTPFQTACYKMVTTQSNWNDAETACNSNGADEYLASILSADESLFIAKFAEEQQILEKRSPWIGGHYEPSLKWSDGQDVCYYHNFTNIDKDYVSPNVAGDSECLNINHAGTFGKWGKVQCNKLRPYVCKRGAII